MKANSITKHFDVAVVGKRASRWVGGRAGSWASRQRVVLPALIEALSAHTALVVGWSKW